VDRLRGRINSGKSSGFISKIRSLSEHLPESATPSSVLLIGTDQNSPLTIIEGNHRVAAAMLVSTDLALARFRFFCGFSPRMTECCWYQTDISTLWRYGVNRMRYLRHDHDVLIERMLRNTSKYPDLA